jgi:P2X purinoceptor 4
MVKQIVSSVLHNVFFTYQTTKEVKIPNTFIAVVNRILQLLIFAYIALYIVWWKKGYQQFQEPRGTSVIKIKGIAKVSGNDTERYIRADSGYLWDTAEYQIPPIEENAFFLATRQIFTYNQQEGNCASALDDKLFCNSTSSEACPKDQPTPNRFGYFTGNCIPSPENASREVCEINAWCPEELVNSTEFILNTNDLDDFTIYLKTVVTFGLFNITLFVLLRILIKKIDVDFVFLGEMFVILLI